MAQPAPPRKKMALSLTESMQLQILDALANLRSRRIIAGFLPRKTAILVAKSWRLAKNQQTTTITLSGNITDKAVMSLADKCPGLTWINLNYCGKLTDKGVAEVKKLLPKANVEREC